MKGTGLSFHRCAPRSTGMLGGKLSAYWHWVVALWIINLACPAQADVIQAWVQRYNNVVSNSADVAHNVAVDRAGEVIVAGYSDHGDGMALVAIKYSGADGSVIWQQRYPSQASTLYRGTDMAMDHNGNVAVIGMFEDFVVKYAGATG